MKHSLLALVTLVALVATAACDKVPLTSPTGSTISLSTSTTIVPVNGFAEITATVIESAGTAVHNGTEVVFLSDFGRLDPPTAKTTNGRATTRFFADGRSGTVKVNASSGAASTGSGTGAAGSLTLLVGGAAAGRLSLRADPPTMPQAGGTVQVYATVTDTNGNFLAGVPVSFTIAAGTGITGTGTLSAPSAITDANGVAQTALTTNQTTTVTGTVTTTPAATANITVSALPAPTVALSCPTTTQAVGVPVNCTVTITVPAGGTSIQSVTINWGDGTGEMPISNASGATIAAHTYAGPGTFSVTAAATDLNSQRGTAVQAVVVNRVLPSIVLDVPASGTAGVPVVMSITPGTTQGQPITSVTVDFGDGTSRTFTNVASAQGFTKTYTTEGGFTVTARSTDASGQVGTTSKAIVITRGAGATITFTNTSAPLNVGQNESFNVSAASGSGGAQVTNIRVTVNDANGTQTVYNGPNNGSFVWTPSQSGSATFTVTATDAAGSSTVLVQTLPVS